MSRATELDNARRLAKWKADQYFQLEEEDLDWIANELVRIGEEIHLLEKRRRELSVKQAKLRGTANSKLDAIVASLVKPAKPKVTIRRRI